MSDTCLITGANRGIGLELVRTLLAAGHRVIATCRDPAAASALADLADAPEPGSTSTETAAFDATSSDRSALEILPLDVVDPDSIARLVGTLANRPLDVLVNNAGVMHRDGGANDIDYDAWLETLAVNTLAPFRLATALKPNLAAAARPRVVTVSSQMGSIERGGHGSVAYRSSKAAVNRAMRSLADEWAADGFAVVVVHPGWVRTDMGGGDATLSPAESAADLARLIAGLAPPDNGRFLNHDGSTMPW